LQEDHYYPFGMNMHGLSSSGSLAKPNAYKFNGGTELIKDFGWQMYDTPFRSYDAQLGRFHQIDPLADSQSSFTPYNFANNDPIFWNDPTGLAPDVFGIVDQLLNSDYGGRWSASGGTTLYESDWDAFWDGFDYIETYDMWDEIDERLLDGSGGARGAIHRFRDINKSAFDGFYYSDKRFEGVPIIDSELGDLKYGAAMTFPGIGIFLSNSYYLNRPERKFDLLRHEFGHILQAQRYGLFDFYAVVAPVSLYSTKMEDHNHQESWTETEANTLSWVYFGFPSDWSERYAINFKLLPSLVKVGALNTKTFKKPVYE
jgi:RHS repeat-associated protein